MTDRQTDRQTQPLKGDFVVQVCKPIFGFSQQAEEREFYAEYKKTLAQIIDEARAGTLANAYAAGRLRAFPKILTRAEDIRLATGGGKAAACLWISFSMERAKGIF